MKRAIGFAAKLAVLAGLGAGLWVSATYRGNDIPSPLGITRSEAALESETRGATAQERLTPQSNSCASQTWPNISPECIAGEAEPLSRTEKPIASVERASSILLRPTKLPELAPVDPENTGSLPTAVTTPKRPVMVPKKVERSRAATKPSKQVVSEPRAPRPMLRESKERPKQRLPATPAEPTDSAPARIQDPVQFRLAERG